MPFRVLILIMPLVAFLGVVFFPGSESSKERPAKVEKEGEAVLVYRQIVGFSDTRKALYACHRVMGNDETNNLIKSYNANNLDGWNTLNQSIETLKQDVSFADRRKIRRMEREERSYVSFQDKVAEMSNFELSKNAPPPISKSGGLSLKPGASALLGHDLTAESCQRLFRRVRSGERDLAALKTAPKENATSPQLSRTLIIDKENGPYLGEAWPAHTLFARYMSARHALALCYGVLDNDSVHRVLQDYIERNDPKLVRLVALKKSEMKAASWQEKKALERDGIIFIADANVLPLAHIQYHPGRGNSFDAISDVHPGWVIPAPYMSYLNGERNSVNCSRLMSEIEQRSHEITFE